ncbi:MAG: TIGR04282 family arsenosugar biosynthesis glycosyltransferase [Flavobacteriales bacterium]|nr:TIGR04282 family arsenosugar biosynthesis glycosyltransferase [Flavobacteriales bacterium]
MGPLLIVFFRKPELGKVKTRLAATVGAGKALEVYDSLLSHTLGVTGSLRCIKQAWYTGEDTVDDIVAPYGFTTHMQRGVDLGERMLNAFANGFRAGHSPVVIIGTDCPGISTEIISEAFDSLTTNDAVIGPARDGGYYLFGLNAQLDQVFQTKTWSTACVARETLDDLEHHNKRVHLLQELIDVDTEKDLIDTNWDCRTDIK